MFVAVQEWYQTDTYNLYQSDSHGVRYALVLEDVRSSRQAEESVLIDILEVRWAPWRDRGPRPRMVLGVGCGARPHPVLALSSPPSPPSLALSLGPAIFRESVADLGFAGREGPVQVLSEQERKPRLSDQISGFMLE